MTWKKGQSGNPGGRNKAREELGASLLRVLRSDFEEHGATAVIEARQKDPVAYLRVCASLLPAQVEVEVSEGLAALLSGRSDETSPGAPSPVEETGASTVCH